MDYTILMITTIFKTIAIALQLHGSYPKLMYSICWVESNHRNVNNPDDGGSPSYGYCQIKLKTANWMKEKYGIPGPKLTPADLNTAEINIFYASLYMKYQLNRYKGDLNCAISAYNAGRCISGNQNTYVKKVLNKYYENGICKSEDYGNYRLAREFITSVLRSTGSDTGYCRKNK